MFVPHVQGDFLTISRTPVEFDLLALLLIGRASDGGWCASVLKTN